MFKRFSIPSVRPVLFNLALGIAGFAGAAEAPQLAVRYSDLDLSNSRDAATLYSRISSAAATVCALPTPDVLSSRMKMRTCESQAISAAVSKVGAPSVIAVYNLRNREQLPMSPVVAQTR